MVATANLVYFIFTISYFSVSWPTTRFNRKQEEEADLFAAKLLETASIPGSGRRSPSSLQRILRRNPLIWIGSLFGLSFSKKY
jgi:hypothetical protein